MAKKDWGNKSGFEKTRDEVFELMLAESGVKKEKKARKESEKDKKWKSKSGFDKTKDEIAELMILEASRNTRFKKEQKESVDPSDDTNLISVRGTAFMAEQERMKRQQMQESTAVSKKYEGKDFTDAKMAREMCFGSVESPLEVQASRTTIKQVTHESREEQILRRAKTGFLGKYHTFDIADEEKIDLEVSKALHAEVHFRNLGYKIDFS